MADQMDGKGRPPKRRSGLTRGQKGLIAAAAVLAVALAGVLAWQSLFVRPDLNTGKTEPQETGARGPAPAATGSGRVGTTTQF